MSECPRSPCFGDRLWTWADDHDSSDGIIENMDSLRMDAVNVPPSNKESKTFLHHKDKRAPMVHFGMRFEAADPEGTP